MRVSHLISITYLSMSFLFVLLGFDFLSFISFGCGGGIVKHDLLFHSLDLMTEYFTIFNTI